MTSLPAKMSPEPASVAIKEPEVRAEAKPLKRSEPANRLSFDAFFNVLPNLATAMAITGISFMASFGIGRLGIGTIAEAVAVGGMVITGHEPTLQWVAESDEPRVIWGGSSALPSEASQSSGTVAGASISRDTPQQSFGVAQSIAAGLFVVSDSLNPERATYNNFSSWLIQTFSLPE